MISWLKLIFSLKGNWRSLSENRNCIQLFHFKSFKASMVSLISRKVVVSDLFILKFVFFSWISGNGGTRKNGVWRRYPPFILEFSSFLKRICIYLCLNIFAKYFAIQNIPPRRNVSRFNLRSVFFIVEIWRWMEI